MAKFCDMLAYLRKRANLTQEELARRTGIGRSAISMYETGNREPDFETLEALADFFNVSMDVLTGREWSEQRQTISNLRPMPATVRVPRLGAIACGEPILAEQNIEGYDEVPDWVKCDFTLTCKGDSMINARIHDGDTVCIKTQPEVENGQIAAVLVEGEFDSEATLKRVRYIDGGVALWPENPAYEPMIFTGEDVEKVRILGLATHFISKVA